MRWRSTRSVMLPIHGVSSIVPANCTIDTAPTAALDPVRSYTTMPAATFWNQLPMLLNELATKNHPNTRSVSNSRFDRGSSSHAGSRPDSADGREGGSAAFLAAQSGPSDTPGSELSRIGGIDMSVPDRSGTKRPTGRGGYLPGGPQHVLRPA